MKFISIINKSIFFIVSSLQTNCTNGRITFERTPGLRLPSQASEQLGPLEFLSDMHPTACYTKCLASENCQAYFFDHNDQKCVLVNIRTMPINGPLEHSNAWSYHRKICLGGKYKNINIYIYTHGHTVQ